MKVLNLINSYNRYSRATANYEMISMSHTVRDYSDVKLHVVSQEGIYLSAGDEELSLTLKGTHYMKNIQNLGETTKLQRVVDK